MATLVLLVLERGLNKTSELIKVPQNMLMVGLFFCILMSHLVHTYLGGMIDAFSVFIINFLLFFIILNAINTERKFKVAFWLIVALITILAFQGIYQFSHEYGWAGQRITISDGGVNRINWIGIFNDPNDLALAFVVAIGALLAFLFSKTNAVIKLVTLPLIAVLLYGVYLTNSRGGMLALMATVFFYFVKRSKYIVLGVIIGAILVAALFAFGPSRMAVLSTDEESAYNRIDLWYAGMQMLKANPFFGVGFNMFTEDLPLTAHNSFVLAAAELGFVGLFFFVGLIYASFKCLSIIQKNDERLKDYAYGLQAGLVGFCAMAFFLSRTYIIFPYLIFALSGALFYVSRQQNKKIRFVFSSRDVAVTVFYSLDVLLLVLVVIKIGI
jgi:O-antigen ligase